MSASTEAPAFQSALKAVSDATRDVAAFFARRSGFDIDEMRDMQQIAFSEKLDLNALEERFGKKYSIRGRHSAEQPRAGYVYLPLYDVRASAGNGHVAGHENAVDVLAFKEEWVRRELRARPEDLNLIYVEGDSMEPDLRAGDIVLSDHTDTMARREGVYVIRMDGALLVKQLQRLPGGIVKVISRNAAYQPFEVPLRALEEPNGFAVIGRVVWACRRF